MSGFSEFLERNVKDISYDFMGLVFPGLLINFSIIAILIKVYENKQLSDMIINFNSDYLGVAIVVMVLISYFIGILVHGMYYILLKKTESTNSKYLNLIKDKFRNGYKIEKYENVFNDYVSEDELLRSALFIIQREGNNHYLTKYLAKRVMYRSLFVGAIICFLTFAIITIFFFDSTRVISILIIMGLSIFVGAITFFMIKKYTDRIVKEITYTILLEMKK